jgi:hypothetical protein
MTKSAERTKREEFSQNNYTKISNKEVKLSPATGHGVLLYASCEVRTSSVYKK